MFSKAPFQGLSCLNHKAFDRAVILASQVPLPYSTWKLKPHYGSLSGLNYGAFRQVPSRRLLAAWLIKFKSSLMPWSFFSGREWLKSPLFTRILQDRFHSVLNISICHTTDKREYPVSINYNQNSWYEIQFIDSICNFHGQLQPKKTGNFHRISPGHPWLWPGSLFYGRKTCKRQWPIFF